MNITHHELYNALYIKMRPYIIGDDRKLLYFTMRSKGDPELQNLITKLNMQEIFIVKKKNRVRMQ